MTEVSSQIQALAAVHRAESVKYFEGTEHDMKFTLWIALRIRAMRDSSCCTESGLRLHNFTNRPTEILDPEMHLDSATV